MKLKEFDKVKQVRIVEGTVFKSEQTLKVGIFMLKHKLIWRVIHSVKQLITFVDDRFALTPSQNCRKKCGNFDVLFNMVLMWDANRVIGDKARLIVLPHL